MWCWWFLLTSHASPSPSAPPRTIWNSQPDGLNVIALHVRGDRSRSLPVSGGWLRGVCRTRSVALALVTMSPSSFWRPGSLKGSLSGGLISLRGADPPCSPARGRVSQGQGAAHHGDFLSRGQRSVGVAFEKSLMYPLRRGGRPVKRVSVSVAHASAVGWRAARADPCTVCVRPAHPPPLPASRHLRGEWDLLAGYTGR